MFPPCRWKPPVHPHLPVLLWGYFLTHQPTHHIQSTNTDTIVDVCWVVFIFPPIIMSLPWILLHYVSCGYVSADVTLTIALSPRKWQEGAEHHQKILLSCLVLSCLVLSCLVLSCLVSSCLVSSSLVLFFGVFLSVSTKGAQLCNVKQANTRVFLVKSLLSCVLLSVCFSRTSFYLCLF